MASPGYLYHVTYYRDLERIADEGLVPGRGEAIGSEALRSYKQGRIFLTNRQGIKFWMDRAEDFAYHTDDSPAENGFIPVALRILISTEEIAIDQIGTKDSRHDAYYCECEIAPEDIEIFNGEEWLPIEEWYTIDTSLGVDNDGYLRSKSGLTP